MSIEELEELLFDNLTSLGGAASVNDVADLVLAAGIDPATLSEEDFDHLLEMAAGSENHAATSDHGDAGGVKFGAGTCYRCGGRGYTRWPSSGTEEACWYCNGSGVGH